MSDDDKTPGSSIEHDTQATEWGNARGAGGLFASVFGARSMILNGGK